MTAALRLEFAFAAGAATFLAPCAYPLLPGYVAFYLGSDVDERPLPSRLVRAALVGLVVGLGVVLVYGVLAGAVVAVGAEALSDLLLLEPAVGLALVGLGAAMALGWSGPARLHVRLPERRRSVTGFLLFGVAYAAAAAGCTAPLFVAVALTALGGGPVAAAATLGAYAAGTVTLVVAVTVASALGRRTLLRRLSGTTGTVTRVAGALLVLAGLAQVYLFVFAYDGLAELGIG